MKGRYGRGRRGWHRASEEVGRTHKCFSNSWSTVEEKDLTFTLVLDEVGTPYLRSFASIAWVRVFVYQRLDHHLSFLGHDELRERISVGLGRLAVSDIQCF